MFSPLLIRRGLKTLGLATSLAAPLAGQNALLVEHDGHAVPVLRADGSRPLVEENGKLVPASGSRFALKPITEFLPVYISVRHLDVQTNYTNVEDSGAQINNELKFHATFESPYRLESVFLLLDLDTDSAGKVFFLWEVGTLEPHSPKPISLTVPLVAALGRGRFQFHLFAGGPEVLHSELPFDFCEAVLDRMVAKRVENSPDTMPKPFVGPAPEYPERLRKTKIAGRAVVSIRVSPRGRVLDPVVKNASDPAFGESALAAVRQWRFLPLIKNGEAQEMKVDMPFVFAVPKD